LITIILFTSSQLSKPCSFELVGELNEAIRLLTGKLRDLFCKHLIVMNFII
jgi:hypothetical protein